MFSNRLKEEDESPIVRNDSVEDGLAALEIAQAEGRSYQGINNKPLAEGFFIQSHDIISINDGIWISLIDNSKSATLYDQRNEAVQSSISNSNLALDSDPPSFLTNSISPINPNVNVSTESGVVENGETVYLDGTQIAPDIIRGKY